MGVSTVTAARIHAGQKLEKLGEEHFLSFEQFPNLGLLKVTAICNRHPINFSSGIRKSFYEFDKDMIRPPK